MCQVLDWRRGWDSNPRYGLSPYNGLANHLTTCPLLRPNGRNAWISWVVGARTARTTRMRRRFYRHASGHSLEKEEAPRFGWAQHPRGSMQRFQGQRNDYAPAWQACIAQSCVQSVRAWRRNTHRVRAAASPDKRPAHPIKPVRRRGLYREEATAARRRSPGFPTAQRPPGQCGNQGNLPALGPDCIA
jgi:hypothetical protein